MTEEIIRKNIVTEGMTHYLIRIDGDAIGLSDTEEHATKILDSIASSEEKRMATNSLTVFKRTVGKEIHIYTQSIGRIYNGKINKAMTLDIVPIPQLNLVGTTEQKSGFSEKSIPERSDSASKLNVKPPVDEWENKLVIPDPSDKNRYANMVAQYKEQEKNKHGIPTTNE